VLQRDLEPTLKGLIVLDPCSQLLSVFSRFSQLVRTVGFEPTRPKGQQILSREKRALPALYRFLACRKPLGQQVKLAARKPPVFQRFRHSLEKVHTKVHTDAQA